jgi:hypothetical protein
MATTTTQHALAGLQQLDMAHRHASLEPHHSQGVASALVKRLQTIRQPVPNAVQRYQDRAVGVKGHFGIHDKLARDLFNQSDYKSLNPAQQNLVAQKESELRNNPAEAHPYTQKGFTFGQARHVLMGLYRLQSAAGSYPQEIRAKISELADSLEKDIADSARKNNFYPEYSSALKAVKDSLLNSRQPAGIPSTTNFGRPPMTGAINGRSTSQFQQ